MVTGVVSDFLVQHLVGAQLLLFVDSLKEFVARHLSWAQFLLFTSVMTTLWLIERMTARESARVKMRHSLVNVFLVLFVLPIQWLANFVAVIQTNFQAAHHIGLIYLLPHPDSFWVKYVFLFFAIDCLEYSAHRLMHTVPFLWRFHQVHHTDERVDVSTTLREHPGETVIRNLVVLGGVLVCGAPLELLIFRQTLQTFSNLFLHLEAPISDRTARIIGHLFMTPNLHKAHHHFKLPFTNCNFGDLLTIWDRVFGTLRVEAPKHITIGLDTHMHLSLSGQDLLWIPLRSPQSS